LAASAARGQFVFGLIGSALEVSGLGGHNAGL
jgi:hypothetical protein